MSFESCIPYFWQVMKGLLKISFIFLLSMSIMGPLEKLLKAEKPSLRRKILETIAAFVFFMGLIFLSSRYIFPYFTTKFLPHSFLDNKESASIASSIKKRPGLELSTPITEQENPTLNASKKFFLENDRVKIEIAALGGDISNIWLKEYAQNKNSQIPMEFSSILKMRSGWEMFTPTSFERLPKLLHFDQEVGVVDSGDQTIVLKNYFHNEQFNITLEFTKKWRLSPDSYVPILELSWKNFSSNSDKKNDTEPFSISEFCEINLPEKISSEQSDLLQLQQTDFPKMVLYNDQNHYKSLNFKNNSNKNLAQSAIIEKGWLGISMAPFLSAIFPPENEKTTALHQYHVLDPVSNQYRLGFESLGVVVEDEASNSKTFALFFGPMDPKILASVAPKLELALDHGKFLWPIRALFLQFLQYFYNIFKNWGWALLVAAFTLQSILSLPFIKASISLERQLQKLPQKFQNYDDLKVAQENNEQRKKLFQVGTLAISFILFFAIRPLLLHSIHLRQQPFLMQLNDLSQQDASGLLVFALLILQKFSKPDLGSSSAFSAQSTATSPSAVSKILGMSITAILLLIRLSIYQFVFWKAALLIVVLLGLVKRDSEQKNSNWQVQSPLLLQLIELPWSQALWESFSNLVLLEFMSRLSVAFLLLVIAGSLAELSRKIVMQSALYFIQD